MDDPTLNNEDDSITGDYLPCQRRKLSESECRTAIDDIGGRDIKAISIDGARP